MLSINIKIIIMKDQKPEISEISKTLEPPKVQQMTDQEPLLPPDHDCVCNCCSASFWHTPDDIWNKLQFIQPVAFIH